MINSVEFKVDKPNGQSIPTKDALETEYYDAFKSVIEVINRQKGHFLAVESTVGTNTYTGKFKYDDGADSNTVISFMGLYYSAKTGYLSVGTSKSRNQYLIFDLLTFLKTAYNPLITAEGLLYQMQLFKVGLNTLRDFIEGCVNYVPGASTTPSSSGSSSTVSIPADASELGKYFAFKAQGGSSSASSNSSPASASGTNPYLANMTDGAKEALYGILMTIPVLISLMFNVQDNEYTATSDLSVNNVTFNSGADISSLNDVLNAFGFTSKRLLGQPGHHWPARDRFKASQMVNDPSIIYNYVNRKNKKGYYLDSMEGFAQAASTGALNTPDAPGAVQALNLLDLVAESPHRDVMENYLTSIAADPNAPEGVESLVNGSNIFKMVNAKGVSNKPLMFVRGLKNADVIKAAERVASGSNAVESDVWSFIIPSLKKLNAQLARIKP